MKIPGTCEGRRRAAFEIYPRRGIIFHRPVKPSQHHAFCKEFSRHVGYLWIVERPQGEVDEVNSKIDQAPAARQFAVEKPRFVGAVRIMKNQVDGEDTAQLTGPCRLAYFLHSVDKTI